MGYMRGGLQPEPMLQLDEARQPHANASAKIDIVDFFLDQILTL